MRIWPWSTIRDLRRELVCANARTDACGLAAMGAYGDVFRLSKKIDPYDAMQSKLMFAPQVTSAALVEVMRLRTDWERLTNERI